MEIFYALLAFCLFGTSAKRIARGWRWAPPVPILPDNCKNLSTQENLDINRFKGRWYQTKVYLTNSTIDYPSCGYLDIILSDETIKLINYMSLNHGRYDLNYTSTTSTALGFGKGLFKSTVNSSGVMYNERVLGTDYESYAVIYKCKQPTWRKPAQYGPIVLILTRSQKPSKSTLAKIAEIVDKNKFSESDLTTISQENCEKVDNSYTVRNFGQNFL